MSAETQSCRSNTEFETHKCWLRIREKRGKEKSELVTNPPNVGGDEGLGSFTAVNSGPEDRSKSVGE